MGADALAATRLGLHRVAAYVVSPARRHATGHEISLRVLPGGFGTPPFGDDEQVRVDGTSLVHRRGAQEQRVPLTTLRAAGRFVGVEPDVEWARAFDIPPPGDPDAPLALDEAAAARLAGWHALVAGALEALRAEAAPDDAVTSVLLWPEHFDAAIDLGAEASGERGTYGGSPGDGAHPEPYLYVSPWQRRTGPRWNEPAFGGASVTEPELMAAADPPAAALAFLRGARDELLGR